MELKYKLNEKNIEQQLKLLRQKHDLVVMELVESRQKEQQLKKLNQTLIDNLGSNDIATNQSIRQIKLIVEGAYYDQRVSELSHQLSKLHSGMEQQIDNRVRNIVDKFNQNNNKQPQRRQCQSCYVNARKIKKLQQQIEDLTLDINTERDHNDKLTYKTDINIYQLEEIQRNNHDLKESNIQLTQQNRDLKMKLDIFNEQFHRVEQYWQQQYDSLLKEHEDTLQQLERMTNSQSQIAYSNFSEQQRKSRASNQMSMMKQIQNIVKQLNTNRREKTFSRKNEDWDFSIKQGINRPSKGLTFY